MSDLNPIEAAGAYVPRYRITAEEIGDAWDGFRARGVHEKRVPAGDEDAVTMAVEAARDALAASDKAREDVEALALATTTPPIEEGDIGVQVAEMLGLADELDVSVFTQSTRAGTRALLAAARADGPALAVAADAPVGGPNDAVDHAAGAGAVALLTGPAGSVALTDSATFAREYPGTRFRQRGSDTVEEYGATTYERDAYSTALAGAVDQLDVDPDALALSAPNGSLPSRGARALGLDADVTHLAGELGDTGAASALFSLLAAWETDANKTLVVGYGDGAGADAVMIQGHLDIDRTHDTTDITYAEYLRKRGHVLPSGGEN